MHNSNIQDANKFVFLPLVAYSLVGENSPVITKINVILKLEYMPDGWCYGVSKRDITLGRLHEGGGDVD